MSKKIVFLIFFTSLSHVEQYMAQNSCTVTLRWMNDWINKSFPITPVFISGLDFLIFFLLKNLNRTGLIFFFLKIYRRFAKMEWKVTLKKTLGLRDSSQGKSNFWESESPKFRIQAHWQECSCGPFGGGECDWVVPYQSRSTVLGQRLAGVLENSLGSTCWGSCWANRKQ